MQKIILFANTNWYLFNFCLSFAQHLRDNGWNVVLISPPGEYGTALRNAGFQWHPIPMQRRSLNSLRELALVLRLCRLFRKERPESCTALRSRARCMAACDENGARRPTGQCGCRIGLCLCLH